MREREGRESSSGRASRRAVLAVAFLAAAFCAATVVGGLLEERGAPAAAWLRGLYAPICHQIPERSLSLGDGQARLPVCARCSGLHAGGAIGLFLGVSLVLPGRLAPRPWWLALTLAPILVDVGSRFLGFPGLPNLPRAIASLPAGAVAGMFLSLGVGDWFDGLLEGLDG